MESHYESDLNRSLFFLQETCLSVQKFIQGPLDRYAVNVTTAAKLCKVYVTIIEDVVEKHLNPPPICICLKVAVRNMP